MTMKLVLVMDDVSKTWRETQEKLMRAYEREELRKWREMAIKCPSRQKKPEWVPCPDPKDTHYTCGEMGVCDMPACTPYYFAKRMVGYHG